MSDELTRPEAPDFARTFVELEAGAEKAAPGVMDIIEAYQRSIPQATAWRPMNVSAVAYGTGASRSDGQ